MDELVIGDKRYLSSKRAAELTGYAKDYIGQLCREGRVEAKLVGRSWYVLESAIREHRFGKDEDIPVAASMDVDGEEAQSDIAWESPNYIPEVVAHLPELKPRIELKKEQISIQDEPIQAFSSDISRNEAILEAPPQAREREDEAEVIDLHRIKAEISKGSATPIGRNIDMPKRVDTMLPRQSVTNGKRAKKPPVKSEKARKGRNLVGIAIITAAALISVSVMLVGTGFVSSSSLTIGVNNSFINFLAGKSFYNR